MKQAIELLRKRFGFPPEWLEGLGLFKDQQTIFVGTREVMEFKLLNPLRRGIRLCRLFPHSVKPTTSAMQLFGKPAEKNVIELSTEQARRLINGGSVEIEAPAEDGFVILLWRGFIVGVGLYKKPTLKSCIPKNRPVD